jgi:hypothetical protein
MLFLEFVKTPFTTFFAAAFAFATEIGFGATFATGPAAPEDAAAPELEADAEAASGPGALGTHNTKHTQVACRCEITHTKPTQDVHV